MFGFIKKLLKKPSPALSINNCPDPCLLTDLRDYLYWSGVDSLSFIRNKEGMVHMLVQDGNVYHNVTYWMHEIADRVTAEEKPVPVAKVNVKGLTRKQQKKKRR